MRCCEIIFVMCNNPKFHSYELQRPVRQVCKQGVIPSSAVDTLGSGGHSQEAGYFTYETHSILLRHEYDWYLRLELSTP